MNVKHIWSVLCKESVINKDDNLVSLYSILEELTVALAPTNNSSKLPNSIGVPIHYELVSLWFKDRKKQSIEAEIEYTLISPEGSELLKTVQNIEIPINVRRFRSRMKIAGLPITKAGDYSFKIRVKEVGSEKFELVSELPLEVKISLENPQKK